MSEKDDWKTFYQHLATNHMNFRIITVGSTAELNSHMDGFESDIDMMFYYTDIIGVASSGDLPKGLRGRIMEFNEYLTRPGYVQIQQKDRDFLLMRTSQLELFRERKGPAHKLSFYIQRHFDGSFKNPDIDAVLSITCHGWPTAARTWTTRCCPSGWPPNDVVESVVDGGYHLVEKSHPLHTGHDILWRISFSKAELRLIES